MLAWAGVDDLEPEALCFGSADSLEYKKDEVSCDRL